MPREYSRCVGVALATWLPVAAVLGALQAVGLLTGASAAAAAAAGLIVAMLIALAFAASLAGLRRMIEGMGAIERLGEANGPIGAAAAPLVGRALWPGLMRLRGTYDARLIRAETRLAAAEAVIAAIPDPLLLIDARRRIVRANQAAAALIGRRAEPGDLAGALRNPVLLSAVNSLLRGEVASNPGRSIEFNLSGTTDRVLRAHLARIDGPALDGAVALLILDDITAL